MFTHTKLLSVIFLIILTTAVACSGEKKMEEKNTKEENKIHYNSFKDIPSDAWKDLSQKKIFFGHQSVGYNILEGVQDIMKDNHSLIKLKILETTDPADYKDGVFGHSKVGKNSDPESKIDQFSNFLNSGIAKKADIAFMKFCYVDFKINTDAQKVFNAYKDAISRLKKAYPDLMIIHSTVPLTQRQTGIKAWIKKMMGRPVWGEDDNIKRFEYNEMLKNEYEEKYIFDIALSESTRPDGTKVSFMKDGKTYFSMAPEYTTDGGHLNEKGRKQVAEKLLLLLINL